MANIDENYYTAICGLQAVAAVSIPVAIVLGLSIFKAIVTSNDAARVDLLWLGEGENPARAAFLQQLVLMGLNYLSDPSAMPAPAA